jgi:hypothetical protein
MNGIGLILLKSIRTMTSPTQPDLLCIERDMFRLVQAILRSSTASQKSMEGLGMACESRNMSPL